MSFLSPDPDSGRIIQTVWAEFVSAEGAELDDGARCVVLDFGEGGRSISLDDARDLVTQVLGALAAAGDDLAREIGDRYFGDAP